MFGVKIHTISQYKSTNFTRSQFDFRYVLGLVGDHVMVLDDDLAVYMKAVDIPLVFHTKVHHRVEVVEDSCSLVVHKLVLCNHTMAGVEEDRCSLAVHTLNLALARFGNLVHMAGLDTGQVVHRKVFAHIRHKIVAHIHHKIVAHILHKVVAHILRVLGNLEGRMD